MIAGINVLITAIVAGGWITVDVIFSNCLFSSTVECFYFCYFFSSEKITLNSITTKEVVTQCNKKFGDKLRYIQDKMFMY